MTTTGNSRAYVRRTAERLIGRALSQTSPLVDARQAAKLLAVPPTWLLAQARANAIPHHRLGHYVRFDTDELIEWARTNRRGPALGDGTPLSPLRKD